MVDKKRLNALLRSPKTRKYGKYFLVLVAFIGIIGFFVLPPIAKSILVDRLAKTLHRSVVVQSVNINPYALSVTLEGVSIQERESGELFAAFDQLYLNLESSSLFRGGLVLGEFRLHNPKLKVVRLAENRYNFSDIVDGLEEPPEKPSSGPFFSVNNIQIIGGEIEFEDRPVNEKHQIAAINLALPSVSNMAHATAIFVEPSFSARINGAPLQIQGRSKPFSETLESELILDLDDLPLKRFLGYSPVRLPFDLVSGTLDTRLKLVFHQEKGKPSMLMISGNAGLKSLGVKDPSGQSLLMLKEMQLTIGSADLITRKISIDRITLDSPDISVRASRQGTINWLEFFPKQEAGKPSSRKAPANADTPVEWRLGEMVVTGGVVRWFDESNPVPLKATIEALELSLRDLDSKGQENARFDLGWRLQAEEWLKVNAFSIKDGQLNLVKKVLSIGDMRTEGVRKLVRRKADGRLERIQGPALRIAESVAAEGASPWKISVDRYSAENIGLRFEDQLFSPQAIQSIDGLGLEIKNLSTDPEQYAEIRAHLKLNRKGDVSVEGRIRPMNLEADLNVDLKAIELLPLQPYFSEKLNIAVTRGQAALKGNVQLSVLTAEKEKAGSGNTFTGGFDGNLTVGDFYAVDKLNSADFLRWKSFHLNKLSVRMGPDSISIGDIALSDFFARIIVSPEGKLNLLQIVRQQDEPVSAVIPDAKTSVEGGATTASGEGKASSPITAEKGPALPIRVGSITLQGGNVRFSDNFVKPNYTADLQKIGGRITGLSSEAGTVATLELRGSYDNVSPLNITAKINPLSESPYLDLQADIKGIEMTSFSSYSGKYAGYAIEKGKLSLSVNYKIENGQLQAENRVFLDQLTFGEAVDSPDATRLPVTLAVSLLKNRNGEINLNLPISGSLNDPQFSIGGLIIKVIVNLFVKAVTSPFALIGSMFGGGEDLSSVGFDFGYAAITSESAKRLESLAKALVERPALKLELTGRVDVGNDREGLKRARIDRLVRAAKREDLTRKGIETGSVDTIEINSQDYPSLLERVYRSEKFPKPRNMVGMVKALPVDEMEKLILTNMVISDEDIRALAEQRAKVVLDWLVEHAVPAERIFLLPAKIGEDGSVANEGKATKQSRVDFSLK